MTENSPKPQPAILPGGIPDIPDGNYDVFIVDAGEYGDPGDDCMELSLAIVMGELKGMVLELKATHLGWHNADLIGMPGTLFVEDGTPKLHIDT
ncbi:MAG: hypothetical protein WC184_09855 [Acidimicrobiia bacterium]